MPRILIAGCGYLGTATADLFHELGWSVEGWTSSAESARELSSKPYDVRAVDLTSSSAVCTAGGEFDAVIHCASSRGGTADNYREIYVGGVENLQHAFRKALLLFTSSTSVYAQTAGEWVAETSPATPSRETGHILRRAEELVLARGGIVMRVAGIYGPGRSALLRKFLNGEAVIDSGERFMNQAHRDDIASAAMLLTQTALRGGVAQPAIFNVSDNHPLTQRECYAWLATHLNRDVPPVADAPVLRKRGDSNKRVSSDKLQGLGWTPRYPTFQSAMTDSILPNLERCGA